MQEIELSNSAKVALDLYRDEFHKRYNTWPIMPTMEIAFAATTFKDLIREIGLDRVLAMIRHYLKMNGDKDWFKNNAHSIAVFTKNVNLINASTPSHRHQEALRIAFETPCATKGCKNYVPVVCMTSEMEALACSIQCDTCKTFHDDMPPGIDKLNRLLDSMPSEAESETR